MNPLFVESTDGVRVAVHDFGGDGPLLVLSHATGFCGGAWLPMAEHLTGRFHCVALDYRGHGHTVTPDTATMAWTGMGHDLLAVLDVFSPDEPAFVAGHSMGGAAIVLAESHPTRSDRQGMGLRADPVRSRWSSEHQTRRAERHGRGGPASSSRFRVPRCRLRTLFVETATRSARSPCPAGLRRLRVPGPRSGTIRQPGVTLRCTPAREAETFENSHSGAFAAAATISFDYRVLVSGDGMPPALMAEHAATTHPRMSLARYPDLTHFGPLEAPERIADDAAIWFLA